MSLFFGSCFKEEEKEPLEENCCISRLWTNASEGGRPNATVTPTSTCCEYISPWGCCGEVQREREFSSFKENDLSFCFPHLMTDDSDANEQHLGGQIESQQQLLNLLEEEKAYHQEELALSSAANTTTTSSSSSWWRCGYKPSWSSISFACGGWLQFYEFGISLNYNFYTNTYQI